MKKSVDPYDALASIFLPGGGSEDPDAWAEDRVLAEAGVEEMRAEAAETRKPHGGHESHHPPAFDEHAPSEARRRGLHVAPLTPDVATLAAAPHDPEQEHDDDDARAARAAATAGSFGEAARVFAARRRELASASTASPAADGPHRPHRPDPPAPAGATGPGGTDGPWLGTLVPPGPTRPYGGRSVEPPIERPGEPGRRAAPVPALRRDPDDPGPVELELLVLGHLPIRAATWLVPCVRAIAGPGRAAGLLRCDGGGAELELHGPAPAPPGAPSLAEAIGSLRGGVRRWFLRPSGDASPRSLAAAEPDRVTILTGGDPVAVASAWEVARTAIAAADESGALRPRLGLAVVGVARPQAEAIVAQLDRITRERLSAGVELRCCVPRITPGGVPAAVLRGSGEDADPVRLSELVRGERTGPFAGPRARPDAPSSATAGSASVVAFPNAGRHDDDVAADGSADEPAFDGAPPIPGGSAAASPGRDERPLGPMLGGGLADEGDAVPGLPFVDVAADRLPVPRPCVERHADRPTLARIVPASERAMAPPVGAGEPGATPPVPPRPTYARHVDGLSPLAARSPAHPEVELAVDDEGTLHVLGGVAAVRDLPLVADWAFTHAELLALACPDAPIDPRRRPQGHVFTDDPLAVSDLHRSHLHLHLLAEVEIDGHRGWFTSTLHRPGGR